MAKNISATGTYEILVKRLDKEVTILLEGNFTEEQAGEFISEYSKVVSRIKADDYVLRIDCRDLKLVTPELQPALEACYKLYQDSGFKSVVFEISKIAILKSQLSRIARKVGLQNAIFTEM